MAPTLALCSVGVYAWSWRLREFWKTGLWPLYSAWHSFTHPGRSSSSRSWRWGGWWTTSSWSSWSRASRRPRCHTFTPKRIFTTYIVASSQDPEQGCQMAHFQTKSPNLGKFWRLLQCIFCDHLVYFTAIRYRYFMVIWYIFPVLQCRTKKNLAALIQSPVLKNKTLFPNLQSPT
jgi:hypothetical protein